MSPQEVAIRTRDRAVGATREGGGMANEFMTPDLQLSAFLVALGHQLLRVEGAPARRLFVFAGVSHDDVTAYYRGTRAVAPQQLFTAYRALKRQLYQSP